MQRNTWQSTGQSTGRSIGLWIVSAAMAAGAAVGIAADADQAPAVRVAPRTTIYLYGEADLEKLRQANPSHYARAQSLIAESDEICKPGRDELEYVKYDAKAVSCRSMFIKTSNPPKRELGFTLDDVRYVAVITLKDTAPHFRHVPMDGTEK